MRPIDADVLREKAQWMEMPDNQGINFDVRAVSVSSIDLAPTIEAEPVRHGRWVDGDWTGEVSCYYINRDHGNRSHLCEHTPLNCWNCHMNEAKDKRKKKCSVCGAQERIERPYCPNCGAKMDLPN